MDISGSTSTLDKHCLVKRHILKKIPGYGLSMIYIFCCIYIYIYHVLFVLPNPTSNFAERMGSPLVALDCDWSGFVISTTSSNDTTAYLGEYMPLGKM